MNAQHKALTEQIFLQAVEVPVDQRPVFLERACGGNADLRREVDSLLEHHRPETIGGAPLAVS